MNIKRIPLPVFDGFTYQPYYLEQIDGLWTGLAADSNSTVSEVNQVVRTMCFSENGQVVEHSLMPREWSGQLYIPTSRIVQVQNNKIAFAAYYPMPAVGAEPMSSIVFDPRTGDYSTEQFVYSSGSVVGTMCNDTDGKSRFFHTKDDLSVFVPLFAGNQVNTVLFGEDIAHSQCVTVTDRTKTRHILIPDMLALSLPRFSEDGLTIACLGFIGTEAYLVTLDLDFFHQ